MREKLARWLRLCWRQFKPLLGFIVNMLLCKALNEQPRVHTSELFSPTCRFARRSWYENQFSLSCLVGRVTPLFAFYPHAFQHMRIFPAPGNLRLLTLPSNLISSVAAPRAPKSRKQENEIRVGQSEFINSQDPKEEEGERSSHHSCSVLRRSLLGTWKARLKREQGASGKRVHSLPRETSF